MLSVGAPSAGEGDAVAEPPVTFAALLRQLCTYARLTQEELAEATSLSPRSISDLEHLRRDNTMITTNTQLPHPHYYGTRAQQGRWLEEAPA